MEGENRKRERERSMDGGVLLGGPRAILKPFTKEQEEVHASARAESDNVARPTSAGQVKSPALLAGW